MISGFHTLAAFVRGVIVPPFNWGDDGTIEGAVVPYSGRVYRAYGQDYLEVRDNATTLWDTTDFLDPVSGNPYCTILTQAGTTATLSVAQGQSVTHPTLSGVAFNSTRLSWLVNTNNAHVDLSVTLSSTVVQHFIGGTTLTSDINADTLNQEEVSIMLTADLEDTDDNMETWVTLTTISVFDLLAAPTTIAMSILRALSPNSVRIGIMWNWDRVDGNGPENLLSTTAQTTGSHMQLTLDVDQA